MIPLHNHSMYSALDGFSTPEEIADRCVEIDCPCCGLTDHGIVSGHIHFAQAMEAKGIKPIFGCELYHGLNTNVMKGDPRDNAHLIALAQTDEGLRNLWRLINATSDYDHFHHVGRAYWHDLEKYREGLIVTSACALGLVCEGITKEITEGEADYKALNRYLEIFGDNFWIELHTYPADHSFGDRDSDITYNTRFLNERLVEIGLEKGIGFTYADDAHRAFPDQYWVWDAYLTQQASKGDTIYTPPEERKMWHPPEAMVIHTKDEVREALSYLPSSIVEEAIANTDAIGESVTASLPEIRRHLPMFVPGDCPWLSDDNRSLSPEELFVDLVVDGIERRYGENAPSEVWERTVYEVETLLNDGIHHYFLMGWDEIQFALAEKIPVGPGRGSSAGCIVAYALGITDVDPLHYGLIFERFWNSGRADGFPDIDSDFSRKRRPEVIEYLKKRWGEDKVCAIGTIGYMKPKSTIGKLYKAFGLTFEEAKELKEIVGKTTKIEILGHDQIGWNPDLEPGKVYYVNNDVGQEIKQWIRSGNKVVRQQFVDACELCCSRVQQYGIHASGIVISDVPLADELPAYRRGGREDGVPATMFPMDVVDQRKFIKLDVLGLRTLDEIGFWEELVAEHDVEVEWSGLDLEEHPEAMWSMLTGGYTAGIFQVEDGFGKTLCRQIDPVSVDDLAAIGSLIRPGPAQAGIPDQYVARRLGREPVTYIHPNLEKLLGPILEPTYGLFVYQEQIINFFNALGYTLSESDAMRKIMGKKKPEQLNAVRDGIDEWEGRGYFTMTEEADIPYEIAEQVWHDIEGFADYCFNKSHAVAYGIIGFRKLFLKYYGPAYSYAASLRSLDVSKDSDKRQSMIPQYVDECRKLDIEVRPPDIRYAQDQAYVDPMGRLLFGFSDVHGVGNSGQYVVRLRDELDVDIATPDTFQAGFDAINDRFNAMKKEMVKEGSWTKTKSPKQQLRANQIAALEKAGAWDDMGVREITMTKRQENELEMLGVILTDNTREIMDRNAEEIAGCDFYDDLLVPFEEKAEWDELEERPEYFEYEVCGIITNVSEKTARKSGKKFAIVTIENGPQQVTFTVFSNKWRSHRFLWRLRNVGIFTLHHKEPNDYGEQYIFQQGHLLS